MLHQEGLGFERQGGAMQGRCEHFDSGNEVWHGRDLLTGQGLQQQVQPL